MNKKLLVVLAVLFAMASMASATTASCDNVGVPVNVVGLTVTCGGLTFSNFTVTDFGGAPNPVINLVGATFSNGVAVLTFNPNLVVTAGNLADLRFSFSVLGGINQIDLGVGGSRATIVESVCTGTFDSGGACSGTPLSSATATSLTPNQPIFGTPSTFALTSPAYIYKDISVDGRTGNVFGAADAGALSGFTQSFHTAVPEPMTLSMMGLGLLGLGLVRRRQQGKK
jgi:hypothetical protein